MSNNKILPVSCPICSYDLDIVNANYAGELVLPTFVCPECGFEILVANFENDEIRERTINYWLRYLLDQILFGEKAKELINSLPLFPHSRSEQLIALMSNTILPPINYPNNKSLPPLIKTDIETVKKALNL